MSLWLFPQQTITNARVQILNCQRVLELIHPYVDRELDVVQTSEIELHLQQCDECDLSYRSQIALRSSLQDPSFYYRAPADLKSRITSSLKKEAEGDHTATSSEGTSRQQSEIAWPRRLRARAKRDITVPKGT